MWLAQGHTAGWGWDGAFGPVVSLELGFGSSCLLGHGAPGLVGPPPGAASVSGSSSCPDPHLGCLFTQPRSSDPWPGGPSLPAAPTIPAVVNTQLQAPHGPSAWSLLSCALSAHTWLTPKEFLFFYM